MPSRPHILMCRPEFYRIEYEINPWMNRQRQVDHERAIGQWNALFELIQQCGAKVSSMTPVHGLPDLVFTANAAMIFRNTAFLSRFRHEQRQGEESIDRAWLETAGWEVRQLPDEYRFEGAGDALFCGDTLFAGYRIRSDAAGHQHVASQIDCRVKPLALVDPRYYHLDTCFCPLAPGQAILFPEALDDYGNSVVKEFVDDLIIVDPDEAEQFACNAVVVGRHVITNVGCPNLHRHLKDLGFEPVDTPLGEFVKAGGSAKCLTLRLDGEDAAAWKYE